MKKPAYDGLHNRCVKRIIDLLITGIALCFLWPFYLIISITIALEDGFPVFYRADCGGYKEQPFKICKFRFVVKNADKIGGGTTALHDPRITKVGNVLRKTKLDGKVTTTESLENKGSRKVGPIHFFSGRDHFLIIRQGIANTGRCCFWLEIRLRAYLYVVFLEMTKF